MYMKYCLNKGYYYYYYYYERELLEDAPHDFYTIATVTGERVTSHWYNTFRYRTLFRS